MTIERGLEVEGCGSERHQRLQSRFWNTPHSNKTGKMPYPLLCSSLFWCLYEGALTSLPQRESLYFSTNFHLLKIVSILQFMEQSLSFREDDLGKHSLQTILEMHYRNCWLLKFMSLSFNSWNDIIQQWWYIDCPVDGYNFSKYALGFFAGRGWERKWYTHIIHLAWGPSFSFNPQSFCFSPVFLFSLCL